MNEQWVEIRKAGNYKEMAEILGISPVTARVMRNRGMESIEEMKDYLRADMSCLHSPGLLQGMDILTSLMKRKIEEGAKIRIIGDYDVDGISSTFILYKGLSFFGASCDYRIPHRIEDGYGINVRLIDEAKADGIDTIITCDNGIAAKSQTDHANELGLTMVITDHHEVPFEMLDNEKRYILPNADAIVDPKLPGDNYPFKGICGAFVAYKVIGELADRFALSESAEYKMLVEELTEFAALATICDVMELKDENRAIVKEGLRLMARSRNKGIAALIRETGIEDRFITPYHAGFVIGPCLNASGRLDTSLRALELFLCEDESRIPEMARELKELNENRKAMTIEQTQKAISMVLEKDKPDDVIVLLLEDCHESLAGIIAGRVREHFSRPTFVLTRTEKGLKGSGRSIDAYDMYEHLTELSTLLDKFGGHKLAAGISLEEKNLEAFRIGLNERSGLKEEDFKESVRIDMELPFAYANLSLCKELEKLEPCGTGNERPVFARLGVNFLSGKKLGKTGNVAKYKVSDGDGRVYELTYFGDSQALEDFVSDIYGREKAALLHTGMLVNIKLDICYQISVNTFRGVESPQIMLKFYR